MNRERYLRRFHGGTGGSSTAVDPNVLQNSPPQTTDEGQTDARVLGVRSQHSSMNTDVQGLVTPGSQHKMPTLPQASGDAPATSATSVELKVSVHLEK